MRDVVTGTTTWIVLALAASAAHAGGQQIAFENVANRPDPTFWDDPHATTGGALWIDIGSGPTKVTEDVNLQLMVDAPGGYGWTPVRTLLLSDHTADQDVSFFVSHGYSGMFWIWTTVPVTAPEIPGTSNVTGPYNHYNMEVYAWSGAYDTYADALAHGEYVADSGVFNQFVPYGAPPPPPPDLTSLPAMVLQRPLPGDANLDNKVDINDLTRVLTNYNSTGANWLAGDFNNDQKVDINDLTIVLTNYNQSRGSPSAGGNLSAVPEPSTLVLTTAGLAALLLLARKWRT